MRGKSEFERILEQVRWVQGNMNLVRWNPNRYEELFGHRSIGKALESKQVSYMNPCFDLTAALALRLKETGFKRTTMVVQEIVGKHTKKPVFHFALEVPLDGKLVTIAFKTGKTALVYEGSFSVEKSTNPSEKSLGIRRFSTRPLKASSTLLSFFGVKNWLEIGEKFKYCDVHAMRAALLAMKRADNPALFERVRKMKPRIRRM